MMRRFALKVIATLGVAALMPKAVIDVLECRTGFRYVYATIPDDNDLCETCHEILGVSHTPRKPGDPPYDFQPYPHPDIDGLAADRIDVIRRSGLTIARIRYAEPRVDLALVPNKPRKFSVWRYYGDVDGCFSGA